MKNNFATENTEITEEKHMVVSKVPLSFGWAHKTWQIALFSVSSEISVAWTGEFRIVPCLNHTHSAVTHKNLIPINF